MLWLFFTWRPDRFSDLSGIFCSILTFLFPHVRTNMAAGMYSPDTNCSTISPNRFYSDLFYFSMQTVSTVGYGSLAPYTTTSQVYQYRRSLTNICICSCAIPLKLIVGLQPVQHAYMGDLIKKTFHEHTITSNSHFLRKIPIANRKSLLFIPSISVFYFYSLLFPPQIVSSAFGLMGFVTLALSFV